MSTRMSKSAQNCCNLRAKTPCTASWQLLLLPHWYLPLLSWNHHWSRAWPFKLGVWPTPTEKSCRGCSQGNAEAKRPPTVTKQFFLVWASSEWFWSNEQLRHLVDLFKLTWPVKDELISTTPEYEQIIKGICDINADLPASSTIHFTTTPFPSMSQTNSCHHYAIALNQICLLVFTILWHPGGVKFLILGLGEGDTISHHSKTGARYFCLQMEIILSTFWHPRRLEISQY